MAGGSGSCGESAFPGNIAIGHETAPDAVVRLRRFGTHAEKIQPALAALGLE